MFTNNWGDFVLNKAYLQTPVFLTFFVRHQTLEKVFQAIREVRPRVLFLAGDGPRPGRDDDLQNIRKCREILENIDWECDVHRYYAETNRGILVNGHEGCKKAFEVVDRLIFLEDDMLATKSFFFFCQELLEKYKDDLRIQSICGMNLMEIYNKPKSDYFFSRYTSSGASAFWNRTFIQCDYNYDFLNDSYVLSTLVKNLSRGEKRYRVKRAVRDRQEHIIDAKPKSMELSLNLNRYLYNTLNIIPTKNMVLSIGVAPDSAHALEDIKMMPKGVRELFERQTYDYDFPLRHPKYVICDLHYEKICRRKLASGYPHVLLYRRIASFFLILRYGGLSKALQLSFDRLKIIFSGKTNING